VATNKDLVLAGTGPTSLFWVSAEHTAGPAPVAGTAGVQTVTLGGTATSGTFTLSYGGQVTTALAYGATNTAVQAALVALSTIGTGKATVSGGPLSTTAFTVTFDASLVPSTVVANGAALIGSSPVLTVAVTTPGVQAAGAFGAPATPWVDAGWIDDKGAVKKFAESKKDLFGYGSTSPVRTLISQSAQTFDFNFLESNAVVLAMHHRKNLADVTIDTTGHVHIEDGPAGLPRYAGIIDMVDGLNHVRAWMPSFSVTSRAGTTMAPGAALDYSHTLTAYPDSTGVAVAWDYLMNALKV
jgi:hypothetical protein